ncbi:DNA-processing protein DprA [Robertmurraya massiliosenegalensis]|uniref:DNA-processing protein DprA n=1 Tax=Robertmurraya TaxID=2837507 RepID=UPI0039A4CA4B
MKYSNNEISTYLFCAQLAQTKTTPLTIIEWNAVVKSLSEHRLEPEALLSMSIKELENTLTQATSTQRKKIIQKIEARQKLGISMVELEEIVNQGYGIMFRSHMPPRLKKLTQKYVPAFFYYAGDPSILSHSTLGVVGARNASQEELTLTAQIGMKAAQYGVVIISGGARGVDTTAVEATLQNGGKAVIFPSDGLAKWVKKRETRNYLLNGQLLLMSTQQLNATFTGSYAMQRNKFIHAPSDAVLVASSKVSGPKSSGTWEGVQENLKMQWSPIYVIGNSEGVSRLLSEGNAKPFSTFEELLKEKNTSKRIHADNFDSKAKEVIQFAIDKGMDREAIEKKFADTLAKYFKKDDRKANGTLGHLYDPVDTEQLSIEEVIKEDSN